MTRTDCFISTKELMEDKILDGCLGIGNKITDYRLSEGIADGLPELVMQDDIRFEYNQGKQEWSKKSCTIFQAIGAMSDLWNYKFSLDEIKEYDDLSYTSNQFQVNPVRSKNSGWYVAFAVELICRKWNHDHPDQKVAFYQIDMDNDDLIEKVIDKKYNICTGFYGNVKRQNDYYYDAILNGTSFGVSTYGHAINVIKDPVKGRSIKDNYEGRTGQNKIPNNIYGLEHKCSEIEPFHLYGYVITKIKENNLQRIKEINEIRTLIENNMKGNSSLYHLTKSEFYQKKVHQMNEDYRSWMKELEIELKKYL